MNRITFCGGESTGSVADRTINSAKNESTGSVGVRINDKAEDIQLKTLNRDTVSFAGKNYNDENKTTSIFETIVAAGFTAAALIAGLGCAKKYNCTNKITNQNVKNFIEKYGTDPCYKLCCNIKAYSLKYYNKILAVLKK